MKAWILILLVSVALAGCGGKNDPLSPYLVASNETPDSCFYWEPEGEDAQYLAFAGFTENPGSVNTEALVLEGIQPSKVRLGIFECKMGEEEAYITTVAGAFEDSRQATDWVLAAQDQGPSELLSLACSDQVHVFVDGEIVGGIATASNNEVVQQAVDLAFARILDETGAKEYCPT